MGQVPGEEKPVNEQPQFPVGKLPHQVEFSEDSVLRQLPCPGVRCSAGDLRVFNTQAELHQIHQVAFDGLPVGGHTVPAAQQVANLPLAEPVVLVGVSAQDVQNVHDQQLLGLFGIHGHSLPHFSIAELSPQGKGGPESLL